MYLLTLVVNFIVAFYTMFVRYIYVLQKQNKINKTLNPILFPNPL